VLKAQNEVGARFWEVTTRRVNNLHLREMFLMRFFWVLCFCFLFK